LLSVVLQVLLRLRELFPAALVLAALVQEPLVQGREQEQEPLVV
jgi:hypothetical protein